MRVLCDENVPGVLVASMRARGHDVAWVAEDAVGAADEAILRRAGRERRLLVTFDKDFGRLLFARGEVAPFGLLLIRLRDRAPALLTDPVLAALDEVPDWKDRVAVLEQDGMRIRRRRPRKRAR